jgi:hypothetical protein
LHDDKGIRIQEAQNHVDPDSDPQHCQKILKSRFSSRIRISDFLAIPDPGVKKAPDSRSATQMMDPDPLSKHIEIGFILTIPNPD